MEETLGARAPPLKRELEVQEKLIEENMRDGKGGCGLV